MPTDYRVYKGGVFGNLAGRRRRGYHEDSILKSTPFGNNTEKYFCIDYYFALVEKIELKEIISLSYF